jgi:hypothetical protein
MLKGTLRKYLRPLIQLVLKVYHRQHKLKKAVGGKCQALLLATFSSKDFVVSKGQMDSTGYPNYLSNIRVCFNSLTSQR